MLRANNNKIYAKDDLPFYKKSSFFLPLKTNHNSYFNNKRKILYETHLAKIFFSHITPSFMQVVRKISNLIIPDIEKIKKEHDKGNEISEKMHKHLLSMHDLQILFQSMSVNDGQFYTSFLKSLHSTDPEDFYKQMSIHRSYLKYFWETGPNPKKEIQEMLENQWTVKLDLQKLFIDARRFRNDDIFFKNHTRLNKPGIAVSQNFGLFAPEEYHQLSYVDRGKFINKLPLHTVGMLQHHMTLSGSFSATAMLDYDMPVICGPSGATAMRLALGVQANLTNSEMSLLQFAIAMYNVAIGAHSIDECFIIANDSSFNHYNRGEYCSIFPPDISVLDEYRDLYSSINKLNEEFKDILTTPMAYNSILALRLNNNQNKKPSKKSSLPARTNLYALDLA